MYTSNILLITEDFESSLLYFKAIGLEIDVVFGSCQGIKSFSKKKPSLVMIDFDNIRYGKKLLLKSIRLQSESTPIVLVTDKHLFKLRKNIDTISANDVINSDTALRILEKNQQHKVIGEKGDSHESAIC